MGARHELVPSQLADERAGQGPSSCPPNLSPPLLQVCSPVLETPPPAVLEPHLSQGSGGHQREGKLYPHWHYCKLASCTLGWLLDNTVFVAGAFVGVLATCPVSVDRPCVLLALAYASLTGWLLEAPGTLVPSSASLCWAELAWPGGLRPDVSPCCVRLLLAPGSHPGEVMKTLEGRVHPEPRASPSSAVQLVSGPLPFSAVSLFSWL